MSKVNSLLSERLGKKTPATKLQTLGKGNSSGRILGNFSSELTDGEREQLQEILLRFSKEDQDISRDLEQLSLITAEVKAISNQAAVLHGERIKRAQDVLKAYGEGAFTLWLLSTYGNRQTPYNFLHYYEFHNQVPGDLRPQLERMPRQAVYTLASRQGDSTEKEALVRSYAGESKAEMLGKIREAFPLDKGDRRRADLGESVLKQLNQVHTRLAKPKARVAKRQKTRIQELLNRLSTLIEEL